MGGPFWAKKQAAAWSIPKGEPEPDESDMDAALREFGEEIGTPAPVVDYELLGEFTQPSGKVVVVFAAESDFEVDVIHSNTFTTEWPPHSGTMAEFPEMDDARWVTLDDARLKLVKGQLVALDALTRRLGP